MPFYVPIIQSKSELVHIAAKVLFAGVVVNAMQSALHDRPNTLDSVRVGERVSYQSTVRSVRWEAHNVHKINDLAVRSVLTLQSSCHRACFFPRS